MHMLSQFLAQPTQNNLPAMHKVVCCLKNAPLQLVLSAYCDADWGSCPITSRSVTGYSVLLGQSLVSWKTKKQSVVSRSSAEAEYRAMAHTSSELVWLTRLLDDFMVEFPGPVWLHRDNNSAIHIARNHVFHERTKHDELDCHLERQYATNGLLVPCFISSAEQQPVHLLTKALPADLLTRLSGKLNIRHFLHELSLRGSIETHNSASHD